MQVAIGAMDKELGFIARYGVSKSQTTHTHRSECDPIGVSHLRQHTLAFVSHRAKVSHQVPSPSGPECTAKMIRLAWMIDGWMTECSCSSDQLSSLKVVEHNGTLNIAKRRRKKHVGMGKRKGLVVWGHFHALFRAFKYAFHTLKRFVRSVFNVPWDTPFSCYPQETKSRNQNTHSPKRLLKLFIDEWNEMVKT